MAVDDLWVSRRTGEPTARHGRGLRWRVRVEGWPATSHRTRAEAEAVERDRIIAGPPRPVSSVTVAELLDVWLAGKQGLAPRTVTACRGDARHVRARWGSTVASDVQHHEVQAWIAGLTATVGRGERAVTRPASEALRRRLLGCLSATMRLAQRSHLIEDNPCEGVRVPVQDQREPRFLTAAQLGRLAVACDAWADAGTRRLPGYWAPLVWLLGTTGLRVGEAARLLVGDVDTARSRLRVSRAKSRRGRDVAVPASVLAMLDLGRPAGEPLFVGPAGGVLDPDVWRRRAFRKAAQACGLEGLRIHDLRHTAASLSIAAGASVLGVQATLGHSRASTTLTIYTHLFDETLDEVARRMDAAVFTQD